ncbi:DUF4169 family protein [Paracoccus marinaquae]|uniref:DUF4169 family protein n=1 Tax=Paracoccus marinaquae TaxID=2841926 RepID=A0ABS6AIY3_9RHOB|nr:DUF4169 family protein [Paracoccus marinaquae]MBU3030513.1 DUF4169 family protein [Paracoccus marinaquae]
MTKIVNLRQARKQRDRAERLAEGDANAAKFGESRNARNTRKAEAERSARTHEAHRRDDA